MEVTLVAGADRAVVDSAAGGRLASLVAGDAERLLGADESPMPTAELQATAWGCFLMAPFAGRIRGGRLSWQGQEHQLRRNDGSGNAIHGFGFDAHWSVESREDASVSLACPLPPAWPLGGTLRERFTLRPGELELYAAVEAADSPMPVSFGWHPWFRRPQRGDMRVEIRADHTLEITENLPTGRTLPVTGPTDLRQAPQLGERRLDTPYPSTSAPIVVAWPDLELTMDFAAPMGTGVVYTPVRAIAVEPQTAWPDAPTLAEQGIAGTGLLELGPGAMAEATVTWRWRAAVTPAR